MLWKISGDNYHTNKSVRSSYEFSDVGPISFSNRFSVATFNTSVGNNYKFKCNDIYSLGFL